ncbi:MAG: signal peptidase I [Nanoarchaeota archaeon]
MKKDKGASLRNPQDRSKLVRFLKKSWYFIWYDDSFTSWIVNLILAFVLIKFIIYPGLGLIFGTSFPIVAVVSGSMEHEGGFDEWWKSNAFCAPPNMGARNPCTQGEWYRQYNITKDEFKTYSFKNGFNRGDIMVLFGIDPGKVKVGNVIVFDSNKPYPIIHRVIRIRNEETVYFETKGDHNQNQINDGLLNERAVTESQLLGRAVFRVPYLGYVKIWFTEYIMYPFRR